MLPVARKPIVQYVVEELVRNGIEQILFVTGRNKTSIENHFDHDPELFRTLTAANKKDLLHELGFEELQTHFFYTRQRLQKGLGDAILCGENFAGEDPFLVALGDSILGLHANSTVVHGAWPRYLKAARQLRHRRGGGAARGDQPLRHCAAGARRRRRVPCDRPDREARAGESAEQSGHRRALCFFAADLRHDRRIKPDKRGEIQVTDAIRLLCEEGKRVIAVKLAPDEKRYDIGNFPSYFETFVEFALADPVHGAGFRKVLQRLLAETASSSS